MATISGWGFPVTAAGNVRPGAKVGELTLFNRTGGAPSLAVGMAHIFSGSLGGSAVMGIWYHFAIMFEALFILTILDAGTRVGRFLLQDLLGHFWKPLGRTSWYPGVMLTSGAMVVRPGAISSFRACRTRWEASTALWPLFGISNQLLAAIALCVCTTVLIKMEKSRYRPGHLGSADLAGRGDDDRQLSENLGPEPGAGIPGPRALSCGPDCGGDHPCSAEWLKHRN